MNTSNLIYGALHIEIQALSTASERTDRLMPSVKERLKTRWIQGTYKAI
jgi:hypothetical protein